MYSAVIAGVVAVVSTALPSCRREPPRPSVHVAASLAGPVVESLGDDGDVAVASSFTIVSQALSGMPIDLVMLADPVAMNRLEEHPEVDLVGRRTVARNRLVVVVPAGRHGLEADWDPWSGRRIAVGDPIVVPLGRYTRQSLESSGRWATIQDRLVISGDARAVRTLVEHGEVDMAIVYESDAFENPLLRVVERIDPRTHADIRCEIAIVADRPEVRPVYRRLLDDVDWTRAGFEGVGGMR